MADYDFYTVDRFGENWYSHPDASGIEPIHEELNQPGSFAFFIPNTDPFLGNARPHAREGQVWRNGALKWQGKIQRRELDEKNDGYNIYCEGPLRYFKDLHVGRAGRVNQLTNGSFDAGDLSSWTPIGVTANAVTAWGATPGSTYQANLYQGGDGSDTFLQQGPIRVPGGTVWTLSGYFQIRTDSQWVGPALDGRGLYIERRNPDTNAVEDIQFAAITDDTEKGTFQRVTAQMWSPPGRDSIFWVRLYATRCTAATGPPPGSIIWDDIQLVAMESLSYPHQDLANIVNGLVSHLQDPDFGKADLHITPGATATGILLDRFYQFADHAEGFAALQEFVDAGLGDVQAVTSWDPTWVNGAGIATGRSNRQVRFWVPQQGQVLNLALELDAASGVVQLSSIDSDGDKTFTTTIMQGDGDGPDREEASASDTSLTDGVVIEEIVQAPAGTHHDLLKGMASQRVSKQHGVSDVPALVLSADLTDKVNVGDIMPGTFDLGSILSPNSNYRIITSDLDTHTDQLTIQVVEV